MVFDTQKTIVFMGFINIKTAGAYKQIYNTYTLLYVYIYILQSI